MKAPRKPIGAVLGAAVITLGIGVVFAFAIGNASKPKLGEQTLAPIAEPQLALHAAAGEVMISFSSEPAGAFVTVDGKLICKSTPCSGSVEPGARLVGMRLDRYEAYEELTEIGTEPRGVHARLSARFARLEIGSAPPGVRVAVNGEDWGTTPIEAREVDPGHYLVEIRDRRFRSSSLQVAVGKGARERVVLRPVARPPEEEPEYDDFFKLDTAPPEPEKPKTGVEELFRLAP